MTPSTRYVSERPDNGPLLSIFVGIRQGNRPFFFARRQLRVPLQPVCSERGRLTFVLVVKYETAVGFGSERNNFDHCIDVQCSIDMGK